MIEAEIWVEEFEQGKGLKAYWERMHKDNHYLDVMAMICAAGNMSGVRIVGEARKRGSRILAPDQRPSLMTMAGRS